MPASFYSPYVNRGFGNPSTVETGNGDIFSQVWAAIGTGSSSGAQSTGEIASFLLAAGYSVATISALLNNVSQVAEVTPAMIAAAQQEQLWLEQYNRRTNWLPLVAIGGLILWAASRGR